LNKELSNARAQQVSELFKKISTGCSADGSNLKNVLDLYKGKGDRFPDTKVIITK
jgi:hypothetical protein